MCLGGVLREDVFYDGGGCFFENVGGTAGRRGCRQSLLTLLGGRIGPCLWDGLRVSGY